MKVYLIYECHTDAITDLLCVKTEKIIENMGDHI